MLLYRLGNNLYVNITNACSCDCIFCIRKISDGMGEAQSLWLEREPKIDEVKAAFDARTDLNEIEEIVFCGFGEPMERADDVMILAQYFKKSNAKNTDTKIRLNTNGLVRLINPNFDMAKLTEFDLISVSLNADDAEEYLRVTRPRFGIAAYKEMLAFTADAKEYTQVAFSIVGILEPHRVENCRRLAESFGVPFRVR